MWALLLQLYFSFMKDGTNIKTDTTFVIFNEQVLLLYSMVFLYFFQAENFLFLMFWMSPYLYPNHFTIFFPPCRSLSIYFFENPWTKKLNWYGLIQGKTLYCPGLPTIESFLCN